MPARRLAALVLAVGLGPAAAEPPSEVRDLHFGEVLFHYYQDDHFTALTHLLAARKADRLRAHRDEAELLLGGLQLSYGLHPEAEAIFQRLLTATVPTAIRNRAWYYLGKLAHQKGLADKTEAALAKMEGPLPSAQAGERQLLLALSRLQRRDGAGAAALLTQWEGPPGEAHYAEYNRAVALLQAGDTAAGLALLDGLGERPARSEDGWALRDKANLTLGYARLRGNDPDGARAALVRVRQHSPFARRALLGLGWADTSAGRHAQALAPFNLLVGQPLSDPAVQEAWLALPYLYAQLGDLAQAATLYERAVAAIESEQAALDAAVTAIGAGGLIEALLTPSDTPLPKELPARAYLAELLAGHEFREAVQSYRELVALRDKLAHWAESIGSFDDMVQTREARQAGVQPRAQAMLERLDMQSLVARRQAQLDALARIEREQDASALASAEEQERLQRLDAIDRRLASLPAEAPEAAGLRDRAKLLRGLIVWELETSYPARLWEVRKGLKEQEPAFDQLVLRASALSLTEFKAPQSLSGYRQRIASERARLERLQPELAEVLTLQAEQIRGLALSVLEQRRARLQEHLSSARYGLARLYDRASDGEGAR